MSTRITRRVRLAATHRTPGAARELVRAVLAESGLDDLGNEAMLLTTELVTNGVRHANTEVEVEVAAGPDGLTVTVVDYARDASLGPLELAHAGQALQWPAPDRENGRGLMLIDALATAWGTERHEKHKSVWFRLERPGPATGSTGAKVGAAVGGTVGSAVSEEPLAWLLDVGRPAEDPAAYVGEALRRLCQVLAASGGTVVVDQADGTGTRIWARCGTGLDGNQRPIRVAMVLAPPWHGEVAVAAEAVNAQVLTAVVAERISLVIENHRLREAAALQNGWQSFLIEAGALLAQSQDVKLTTALIPQLLVPRLGQWCAVQMMDAHGWPTLAAVSHNDESELPRLRAQLLRATNDGVTGLLWQAVSGSVPVPLGPPLDGFALALTARGDQIGLLMVGRHTERRHGVDELTLIEDIARRAAFALDNARAHASQREVAFLLQASLLPPALPRADGIGFGAVYVPTGRGDVGGDFYDVVPLPDGTWLVVVGDVSGKGVSAGVVTGLVREVVRLLVRDGRPLREILHKLNETLAERGAGHFCTLALAMVAEGAQGVLDVVIHLAGHDQPLLLRSDGGTRFVGLHGTALGLLDAIVSPASQVTLMPGDALVFYTDGVTERHRGNELFGPQRLRTAAAGLAGLPAEAVATGLRAATLSFSTDPARDDIAILAIRNDHLPTQ